MEVKSVLVTGGAGFIGSHLVEALLREETCTLVVAVDNMSMGKRRNLEHISDSRLQLIEANVADKDQLISVLEQYSIDTVCHLATSPLVLSIDDPEFVFDNIVTMQKNLLEAQRAGLFKKLISFSTSEVYGSSDGIDLNESSRLSPRTPYAAAKAAADLLTESYAKTFPEKIEYTIVRPFNNYGPRKKVLKGAGIIPQAIKAFATGEQLRLVNDGQTSRDFVFVEDTARAVVAILKNPEASKNETFVLATGESRTMKEIALKIAELMGVTASIEYVASRPGDVSYLKGDSTKFYEKLGFKPSTPWEQGLQACIDYYSRDEHSLEP